MEDKVDTLRYHHAPISNRITSSESFLFSLNVFDANRQIFPFSLTCTRTEAHRALELLEDYHSRLGGQQDRALRIAIERVIRIFKSRLFQALLGEWKIKTNDDT